jgi:hypothetical protein
MKKLLGWTIWIIAIPFKLVLLFFVLTFGILPFGSDGCRVVSDYVNDVPFDPNCTEFGSYWMMAVVPIVKWPWK